MSEVNMWREAVLEACVDSCIDWIEADPRASVSRLIQWREQIALDPLVSEDAAALAAKPSLPAELVREIDWAIENGNTGPRSHALLVNIRAAIWGAEDRITLTESGYRAVMQQGAKLNGEVKAGEDNNG